MSRLLSLTAVLVCLLTWGPVQAQEADSSTIRIHVPSDATVFVNGREYQAGGYTTLEFETRLLEPGTRANYDISARVYRNGGWISDRVRVSARPSKIYNVYPELEIARPTVVYSPYNSGYSGGYAQGGGYQGGYPGGYAQGGAAMGGFSGGYVQGGGFSGGSGMNSQPSGRVPGAKALRPDGTIYNPTTGQILGRTNPPGSMGQRPSWSGGRPGGSGGCPGGFGGPRIR